MNQDQATPRSTIRWTDGDEILEVVPVFDERDRKMGTVVVRTVRPVNPQANVWNRVKAAKLE